MKYVYSEMKKKKKREFNQQLSLQTVTHINDGNGKYNL
jgi:hypothetical protein